MNPYRPLFPKVDPEGSASEPADAALAKVSRRKLTTIACVHCRLKKTKVSAYLLLGLDPYPGFLVMYRQPRFIDMSQPSVTESAQAASGA